MDTKQIEYILKIAEENNITHAAEKLFITQPALNQQLLKLEKELGTPLFHRSRSNWRLTEAGEIYVKNAKQILQIKKNTYEQIRDVANRQKGMLSIGFTPGRGVAIFGNVYPIFHREFPEITVVPVEKRVKEMQTMIAGDQLDVAFMTLNEYDRTKDNYINLSSEEILLAVPDGHPICQSAVPCAGHPWPVLDLSLLKYEPFVLMDKKSTMWSLVEHIFQESGFEPNILFETQNNNTILTMIRARICCGLIPAYYVQGDLSGISIFSMPSHPCWQIAASYKKGRYLSQAAQRFIEIAKTFYIC